MLCHFEKGEEAGAGGSPRQRGPPGPQSFPGHSGDALLPEEVGVSCGWVLRSSQPAEWAGMGEQSITASSKQGAWGRRQVGKLCCSLSSWTEFPRDS